MSVISLHRDNKNQFRKFPLKKSSSFISVKGIAVPNDLIANCSITSVYGKHRIYIRQISVFENQINVVIASHFTKEVLGVFYGSIVSDFSVLKFNSFYAYISGAMTIGSSNSATSIQEILYFEPDSSEIEESVIFCHTPPAVRAIYDKKNNKASGDILFGELVNIDKTLVGNSVQFATTYPDSVTNNADKSTYLNNCPTPVIKNINGVLPSEVGVGNAENDGNIYIAGVDPVVFYGVPEINPSTSTITIGLGQKTFTVAPNLYFKTAQTLYVYSTAAPEKYMQVVVLSYSGSSLVVNVTSAEGIGETYSSWSIRTSWPGVVKTETTNLTLSSLCNQKQKSLPPVEVYGFTSIGNINKYYSKVALDPVAANPNDLLYPLARPGRLAGNFNSALRPEYIYWPQFVRSEYYDFWPSP
jgi:hypothetical protein